MEQILWTKTILSNYNYFEKITKIIDKNIVNYSMKLYGDTYSTCNSMINLIDRKIELINLKVIMDKALNKLPAKHSRLLVARYIDRQSVEDMAVELKVCERSVFRRLENALNELSSLLECQGYDSKYFSENLANHKWLYSSMAENVRSQNDEKLVSGYDFGKLKLNFNY